MKEQWEQLKRDYHAIQPPEHGEQEVRNRMEQAKRDQKKRAAKRTRWVIGVAAALAVCIAVPNASPCGGSLSQRHPRHRLYRPSGNPEPVPVRQRPL